MTDDMIPNHNHHHPTRERELSSYHDGSARKRYKVGSGGGSLRKGYDTLFDDTVSHVEEVDVATNYSYVGKNSKQQRSFFVRSDSDCVAPLLVGKLLD